MIVKLEMWVKRERAKRGCISDHDSQPRSLARVVSRSRRLRRFEARFESGSDRGLDSLLGSSLKSDPFARTPNGVSSRFVKARTARIAGSAEPKLSSRVPRTWPPHGRAAASSGGGSQRLALVCCPARKNGFGAEERIFWKREPRSRASLKWDLLPLYELLDPSRPRDSTVKMRRQRGDMKGSVALTLEDWA